MANFVDDSKIWKIEDRESSESCALKFAEFPIVKQKSAGAVLDIISHELGSELKKLAKVRKQTGRTINWGVCKTRNRGIRNAPSFSLREGS